MSAARQRRHALLQAAGLLIAIAIAVAWIVVAKSQPAKADALRVVVGTLRSQAAELDVVARLSDRLPVRFARAHLEQLDDRIADARRELAGLRVEADLSDAARTAAALGERVSAEDRALLASIADGTGQVSASLRESLVADLSALEAMLEQRGRG